MASPYNATFQVFAAGTALTETATLPADSYWAGHVVLQANLVGFTGTLDIQGRPHESAAWVNLPYAVLGATLTGAVAQISDTTATETNTYVVLLPMPEMRVVMARSAGSIGMWGRYYEHPTTLLQVTA